MAVTWLPGTEAARLVWLQNFVLKLALYVGQAGITAGDVTLANSWLATYQWILSRSEQIKTVAQDVNTWKDVYANGPEGEPLGPFPIAPLYPAVPPLFTPIAGMFPQIVHLAERIKNTTGYTTPMGEDLGIEPPVTTPAFLDPVFTALALPNSEVRLEWVKGTSDGVLVEGQRAGETTWTLLGTDRFSPFLDGRPPLVAGQPEVRRYRMRYLDGDEPVGNYSAVVTVTTVP